MLGRFRSAGDPEGERLLDRTMLIAGGDEAGQERVAGADRRARLDRSPAQADAIERQLTVAADHPREDAVGHRHDRLARPQLADLLDGVRAVLVVVELVADELLGL